MEGGGGHSLKLQPMALRPKDTSIKPAFYMALMMDLNVLYRLVCH